MNHLATAFILSAILLSPIIAGRGMVPGNTLVCALGAVGFILAIRNACKHKRSILLPGTLAALLGFLILSLSSLAATESIGAGLAHIPVFLGWVFIFWGALLVMQSRAEKIALLLAIVASGALVGTIGVREYTSVGGDWRVFATFINPGFFGGFLTIVIPLTLALYLATRHPLLSIAAGGALVIEVASLLLTGTRFAIAATVGALLVMLIPAALSKTMNSRQWVRIIVITLLIVPVAVGASKPMRTRVVEGAAQAHSGSFRIVTWKATARMTAAHPILGTGPGTFEIAFPRYALAGYARMAHQGYLQTASECGIPAALMLLAALMLAFAGPMVSAFKWKNPGNEPDRSALADLIPLEADRLILFAALGAMAGFLARNLLDSDLFIAGIAVPFWGTAALGLSLAGTKMRMLPVRSVTAIAMSILAALTVIPQLFFALADIQTNRAMEFLDRGELSSAENAIDSAVKLNPWRADYHLKRSWVIAANPEELPKAIKEVRIAAALEPTRAKYKYSLGRLLLAEGKPEQALKAFKEAYGLDPHSAVVLLAVADTFYKLGEREKAVAMYKQMTALEETPYATLTGVPELVDPSYSFAHFALGNEIISQDPEGAIQEYTKAIKRLDQRDKYADHIAAMAAASNTDPQNEITVMELRMATYSQMAEAYAKLGREELEQKYVELAEKVREKIDEKAIEP